MWLWLFLCVTAHSPPGGFLVYEQVSWVTRLWTCSVMWNLHQNGVISLYLLVVSAYPQWVRSRDDAATSVLFPNLGKWWIEGVVPSLHPLRKHVVALTTSHLHPHRCRLWVFHINQAHSSSTSMPHTDLNQGLQCPSSNTEFGMYCFPYVWHVNLSNMLHAKSLLLSSFPSLQRFCNSLCISFTAFGNTVLRLLHWRKVIRIGLQQRFCAAPNEKLAARLVTIYVVCKQYLCNTVL